MKLYAEVLGMGTVRKLEEMASASILTIGSDRLTRAELAAVGCYNFHAARNLSALLHDYLQVKNLQEVFDSVKPQDLAVPRLGTVSLQVLSAAFEAKKIGGSNPLKAYIAKHLDSNGGSGGHVVTWGTMKHEREQTIPGRKTKKRR